MAVVCPAIIIVRDSNNSKQNPFRITENQCEHHCRLRQCVHEAGGSSITVGEDDENEQKTT